MFNTRHKQLKADLKQCLAEVDTRPHIDSHNRTWLRAGVYTMHHMLISNLIKELQPSQDELHEVGEPCEVERCQECCPHDERDHGICLDCEHEDDGSAYADALYDSMKENGY